MYFDEFKHQLPDIDAEETQDWIDSLDQVVEQEGENRARFLLFKLLKRARQLQVGLPPLTQTRYINTISPEQEPYFPGDEEMERRIRRLIRWNAVAMVLRANKPSRASAATSRRTRQRGDPLRGRLQPLLPRQGRRRAAATRSSSRATPRRASTRARSSRAGSPRRSSTTSGARSAAARACRRTRTRALMPDFWEFPTVSMGLGPLSAIYQARFNRYLAQPRHQGHERAARVGVPRRRRDGRARVARRAVARRARGARQPDVRRQLQPAAARRAGARQRQDHPGAGGASSAAPAGTSSRSSGAASGTSCSRATSTASLVEQMNDDARRRVAEVLRRGRRVHPRALLRARSAPAGARRAPLRRRPHEAPPRRPRLSQGVRGVQRRRPSTRARRRSILAQTVKGWTLGPGVEARNITHQAKKLSEAGDQGLPRPARAADPRREARGRALLPPGHRTPPRSSTCSSAGGARRLRAAPRRASPSRCRRPTTPVVRASSRRARRPPGVDHDGLHPPAAEPACATSSIGKRIVPIIPDEARTFGMDPLFKEVGIYAAARAALRAGRLRTCCCRYREATDGQVLEEGITEAGSMASFTAAATSYATHGRADDPVLHLLFDVRLPAHRRPDLGVRRRARPRASCWAPPPAARRSTAKACSTRTATRHVLASTIPNVRAYDPAFAFELATDRPRRHPTGCSASGRGHLLLHHALQRELPHAADAGRASRTGHPARALPVPARRRRRRRRARHVRTLLAGGSIMQQVLRAQELLAEKFGVAADVWSATSLPAAAQRRARGRALEPPASRPRRRGCPYVRRCSGRRRRADHRGHATTSRPCPT